MNYELRTTNYELNNKAIILITALWIIAILAIFAVSVGRRSAISLKLTSYNTDRLKASFLARAGILRGLTEKSLEYKTAGSAAIDALSQSWANNKELFESRKFGDGDYTLSYLYPERERSPEANPVLYGLMDEQSRININYCSKETMANLLESFDVDNDEAEEIAAAIVDWRDEDNDLTASENGVFYGAEDAYYMGLEPSYHCKNLPFDIIYELFLVRGITREVFEKIKDHITVYGEGRVNINTAGERVLNALCTEAFPNLGSKIARYRQGNDETIGTRDDRWFCFGPYVIERGQEGLVEIKNLQDAQWYANIYSIATEEYNRIKELMVGEEPQFCVSSKAYRAMASANVKKVKVNIETVYSFEEEDEPPKVKFWYQY